MLTHIYYDAGMRPLKDQGVASIITKVLYLEPGKRLARAEVQERVATIIGVRRFPDAELNAGFTVLKQANAAAVYNGQWLLKPNESRRVEQELERSEQRTIKLLEEYFHVPINKDQLRKWFLSAGAAFFYHYSDIATRMLCRQEPLRLSARQILDEALHKTTEDHGLQEYAQRLSEGFRSFLGDYQKPLVYEQIWAFTQAMLAARVVNASIGPDPITIRKFHGARFYLDTNILLLASLEGSTLAPAFEELAKSLHEINATLHIIPTTEEEYIRLVEGKRIAATKVHGAFSDVLLGKSKDPFWETAVARGCTTSESLQTFFDQVAKPPLTAIPGVVIDCDNSAYVQEAAVAGARDQALSTAIAEAWREHSLREKKGVRLAHDASLAAVCNEHRKRGVNAWVATGDRSMQTLAARWAGKDDMPTWISLDSWIQIMAISGVGPGHNPSNYAPMLAALIEAEIHPRDNAFNLEDLADLLEQEDQLKDLPDVDVERFAIQAARNRLTGGSNDVLVRDVRRALQRKKKDESDVIRESKERASAAEQDRVAALTGQERVRYILVEELTRKHLILLRIKAIAWSVVGAGVAVGIWFLANWFASIGHTRLDDFLRILIIPELPISFWRTLERWREACVRAAETARTEADIRLK